jgi:pantoate--beta-alanine ligase
VTPAILHTIGELRSAMAARRRDGVTIGLVPTMGALHAGHAALIERAAAETACVVVSVFVNPTQFNEPGDYARYPRTLEADAEMCGRMGAALVFAPEGAEMYPRPPRSFVEVEELTAKLCGEFRPGHFRGVATVVLKLINIVQPDAAYFGEKDAQQLAVIRRMVDDLNVPVKIVGVETVRESDGLAMSSRNVHLSKLERMVAPVLYSALLAARARIEQARAPIQQNDESDPAAVLREARTMIEVAGMRVEYLEVVDPEKLQPVERATGNELIAAAVWLGATRLIDNVRCGGKR